MFVFFRLMHWLNMLNPIDVSYVGNVIDVKSEQPENIPSVGNESFMLKNTTSSFSLMSVNLLPLNAPAYTCVMFFKSNDVNGHTSNALAHRHVTFGK